MKIVIAPNSFKDSLSAIKVAKAMADGIRKVMPRAEITTVPIADGGDGLIEIISHIKKTQIKRCQVHDPLHNLIEAEFCFIPDKQLAIIEMASASGLRLLPNTKRNPMETSTYGTGEMIKAALDLKAAKILVGLGGSATNDGGTGMAAALGINFLDKHGKKIIACGKNLGNIHTINTAHIDKRINSTTIEAICDVTNPPLGKEGAASVYAPQKGATQKQVKELEAGLKNLVNCIKRDLDLDVRDLKSGGAAGALGMGLFAFLGAELRPGIEVIFNLIELDKALENADLVFTGEGQLDEQTAFGKAPAGVALRTKDRNIPCFAIAGSKGSDLTAIHSTGFSAVFSLCPGPITLNDAIKNAAFYLTNTTEQAFRAFLAGGNKKHLLK